MACMRDNRASDWPFFDDLHPDSPLFIDLRWILERNGGTFSDEQWERVVLELRSAWTTYGQISETHYLQVGGAGNPAVAAAAAALADLMGHNIPLAVLAAFVAEIAQRYKRLTPN